MLEIKGLRKHYRGGGGAGTPALDGISLRIAEGEFTAVLGPSGAGKSTLIRCINRLVEPDAGEVIWNGKPVTGSPPEELRNIRAEIGMVFQQMQLLSRLSVMTNVIAGQFARMPRWRSLLGVFPAEAARQARSALAEVGLSGLEGRRVDALSGGQQQRAAIARVIMQQPKLLLGDEPISSLDAVNAERVLALIARLHREKGMTVVLNLHNVAMAKRYASRIIGLTAGRITFDGPPEQLGEHELKRIYPPDPVGADHSL
ncbi:phosphonate ABC transporter ATP-binding protein [Paenibacillus gansuensis]|uniref:Phosphonate ABC transporter ATP-binding protein n=1 Tax=Paenibacillus gansuensis TaxID=306542 RepID=A0ABW5P7U1_9BACL